MITEGQNGSLIDFFKLFNFQRDMRHRLHKFTQVNWCCLCWVSRAGRLPTIGSRVTGIGYAQFLRTSSLTFFQQKLGEDLRRSFGFRILFCDTTPNASNSDKLVFAIQNTSLKETLTKRLFYVKEANDDTGQGMPEIIIRTLSRRRIPLDKRAFQSYYNARAMSDLFNGAQHEMFELLDCLIPCIPCLAHRLNILKNTAAIHLFEYLSFSTSLAIYTSSSLHRQSILPLLKENSFRFKKVLTSETYHELGKLKGLKPYKQQLLSLKQQFQPFAKHNS